MGLLVDALGVDWDAAGLLVYEKVFDPVARRWERAYREQAVHEFRVELGRLVEGIEGTEKAQGMRKVARRTRTSSGDRKVSVPDWRRVEVVIEEVLKAREGDWRAGFIPLFQGQMEEFGEAWAVELGVDFALLNPEVQRFVDDYAFQFAERIVETTRADLAELVGQAQAEGWSTFELMGNAREGTGLRGLYGGWDALRAEMIARTETIRAQNAGAMAAYQGAGVKEVQWWTAMDDRVCVFCNELQGKKWAIGTPLFQVGDEFRVGDSVLKLNYEAVVFPPLHVFCRCVLLPVV